MTSRTASPVWRPLTDADRAAISSLWSVTFYPGSPDKRFAHQMVGLLDTPDALISESQRAYLCRLVERYRRQIGSEREVTR